MFCGNITLSSVSEYFMRTGFIHKHIIILFSRLSLNVLWKLNLFQNIFCNTIWIVSEYFINLVLLFFSQYLVTILFCSLLQNILSQYYFANCFRIFHDNHIYYKTFYHDIIICFRTSHHNLTLFISKHFITSFLY